MKNAKDTGYTVLEDRLHYLELYKTSHHEITALIKNHQSSLEYSPVRLLHDIVSYIHKKFSPFLAQLLTVDEITNELISSVAIADDPTVVPQFSSARMKPGYNLAGISALTGETVHSPDVLQDPRYVPMAPIRTRSALCIPLKIKHTVAGVLNLEDPRPQRFTSNLVQLLEDLVQSIGLVLENNQLTDNIRRYSEELERKVYEKISELKASEERYRNMVEGASDPILIMDSAFQLTWCNTSAEKLLGYPLDELRGSYFTRITKRGSVHTIFSALKDIIDGRPWAPTEISLLSKDSVEKVVEANWTPIAEGGKITHIEMILRDITEKQLIDRLKQDYTKTLEKAISERTREIQETQRASILAIANLAESIDPDTKGHLQRVRNYTRVLAEELRHLSKYQDLITQDYIDLIYDLSPLHDLGKVGIRDNILLKPDKLTTEEFEIMKKHSEIGADALKMAGELMHRESIFSIAEMIARFHHERWDGKGYPAVQINGELRPLKGEEIPLCARIVALADVYDALISKRPYKEPYTHEMARKIILEGRATHFDPDIVDAFVTREQDFIRFKEKFTYE